MSDQARLSDILERIDRIMRATKGGRKAFVESEVILDAVIRNLEVIGEAAKAVGAETRKKMPGVPWREMARFRDLAIHQYGRVLADEVWGIVERDLSVIKRAVSKAAPRRARKAASR